MSRSDKSTEMLQNPAELFLKWSSDSKAFYYYDKNQDKEVTIPNNTPFIVLDTLNTCAGYDKNKQAGLWSNEVRNIKRDVMYLRAGKALVKEGVWSEIKGYSGVKFAKSVYAIAKIEGEYMLVNFKMAGCASSVWFDFVREVGGEKALYGDLVVACADAEGPLKNGSTVYYQPNFKVVTRKLSEEASELAIKADKELQSYLRDYFNKSAPEENEDPKDLLDENKPDPEEDEDPKDLFDENPKEQPVKKPENDDDDIPF